MKEKVKPGISSLFEFHHYSPDEQKIIKNVSSEWLVTSGDKIAVGKRKYSFFIVKPTDIYIETFNLQKELIVVFSPDDVFLPRILDSFDNIYDKFQRLRLEKICTILISKDKNIVSKLQKLLTNDIEAQAVIPFSYEELIKDERDPYFMRDRFQSCFYSRDLFAFESPLRKDTFFFGRNDLVLNLVNRHRSFENSGLFGLRKTGKTSVIFGVERVLQKMNENSIRIDCQNPSFHQRRWNKALFYIINEIKQKYVISSTLSKEDDYTDENAASLFEKDLKKIINNFKLKSILIIFDEIENITFEISPSSHWSSGLDFIFFWQSLRSIFQRENNLFTYLIVGTNPISVETASIKGKDNPIFNQVPFNYIFGFKVDDTKEMVNRIGTIMGLSFDDIICSKLTDDFGGHPYLIRHMCSLINRNVLKKRPAHVNKLIYEDSKKTFINKYSSYTEMILTVLIDFYKDEYEMLKYLAIGENRTFFEFSNLSPNYTNHLLGYGIIEKHDDGYCFKIEAVKDYLMGKHKYVNLDLSQEDILKEISERRNRLEPLIRHIIRTQFIANYGKKKALNNILNIIDTNRRDKFKLLSYDEIFDSKTTPLYFEDLRKIIIEHWDVFSNIFEIEKRYIDSMMKEVNKYRPDAHAKTIDKNELDNFRKSITQLEQLVDKFLE
ncbi:MAG: hypothetical protein Q7U10_11790 [Thermodesulfovibrionia bacterium]|nr:hypothetical protein [Thermodesulfovibrionia bacterium]